MSGFYRPALRDEQRMQRFMSASGAGIRHVNAGYWNPSDNGPSMVLSNNNATVTGPATPAWSSIRSVSSRNSGKWYAENLIDTNTPTYQVFGVALSTATLTSYLGSDNFGWSIQNDTNSTLRGTGQQGYPSPLIAPVAGERNMVAYDPATGNLWFGSKGIWATTNAGVGDPGAGTNPTFILTAGSTLYLAVSAYSNGQVSTLKNQSGENAHAIPSGFAMWG